VSKPFLEHWPVDFVGELDEEASGKGYDPMDREVGDRLADVSGQTSYEPRTVSSFEGDLMIVDNRKGRFSRACREG
jgi:hypothetical protein